MAFTTSKGEGTVAELAARLFGVDEHTALARGATQALIEANPELEDIGSLPSGTVVEVPEVKNLEPVERLRPVAEPADVLATLKEALDRLDAGLHATAEDAESRTRRFLKILRSGKVHNAAREDPRTKELLDRIVAWADARLKEARALRDAQRRGLAELQTDLDALLKQLED